MSENVESVDEGEIYVETPPEKLDAEWVPRNSVEPNEWNPNEINSDEASMLRKSITNHGWTRPIVVHAEDDYIIDGEQRWTIAQHPDIADDENLTPDGVPAGHVPVFGISVTEEQAKVSTIQHNRARGFVEYDSLYEYLTEFNDDGQLESVMDELNMDDEQVLRIVDQETVADAVARDHDIGKPWVPADISEFDDDEMPDDTSLSDSLRDGDGVESERMSAVLTKEEHARVRSVFPDTRAASILVAYCEYLDEQDLIRGFQTTYEITVSEEYPHPDELEDGT